MKKGLTILLVLLLALSLTACKSKDYKEAMSYYVDGHYDVACQMFEKLGDYEDSIKMMNKCNYAMAEQLLEKGKYDQALELYRKLGGFEDSEKQAQECMYRKAVLLVEEKDFDAARPIFEELGDYRDSAEQIQGMKWFAFLEYVSDQGGVTIKNPDPEYTIVLEMAGEDLTVAYYCFLASAAALIQRDSPYATLVGEFDMEMGYYHVKDTGSAKWNISTYKSGDNIQWDELDHYDSGMKWDGTFRGYDAEEVLSGGVTIAALERMSDGIQRAIDQSGLDITMADLGFTSY